MNASAVRAPKNAVAMPPVRAGAAPLELSVEATPAMFETSVKKDAGHLSWIAAHKSLCPPSMGLFERPSACGVADSHATYLLMICWVHEVQSSPEFMSGEVKRYIRLVLR